MSFAETLNKLFSKTNEKSEKEEKEIINSLALTACEGKHKVLIKCYKASWIGGCQNEMESFWKCVNENKAILKEKVKTYKENNLQNKT